MARTAGQKRAAKRGRPLMPDVEREPNGRASRRKLAVIVRKDESERAVKSVAMEARERLYGISDKMSDRPEAGYTLGRLFLFGMITKEQLDAGNHMAEDFARYYGLTGVPFPSARAQDLFRVRGMPGPDRADAARAASNAIMAIEMALGLADQSGRPVTTVTKRVCVQDDDTNIHHAYTLLMLQKGLSALAVHYSGRA